MDTYLIGPRSKKRLDFCRILESTFYRDFVLWLRQNDCTAKYFWKGLGLSETSISTSRYLVLSRVLLHRSSPSTMVASNRNALNRDPPRILSATVLFAKYLHTSRMAPSRIRRRQASWRATNRPSSVVNKGMPTKTLLPWPAEVLRSLKGRHTTDFEKR